VYVPIGPSKSKNYTRRSTDRLSRRSRRITYFTVYTIDIPVAGSWIKPKRTRGNAIPRSHVILNYITSHIVGPSTITQQVRRTFLVVFRCLPICAPVRLPRVGIWWLSASRWLRRTVCAIYERIIYHWSDFRRIGGYYSECYFPKRNSWPTHDTIL